MSFFPSSVPTALDLITAKNNISVLLSAGINDVITTIPVVDTSNLPASGYVTAEDGSNEVIHYTGKTATSLTGCTRGADSTTASAHGNGQALGMWGNSAYHNILTEEIRGICQNLNDRIGLSATQILAQNGTLPAPAYSFAGDTDSGLYLPAVGSMELVLGGNGQVTWVNNATMRPTVNNQLDLGQSSYRWGNAYSYRFHATDFMTISTAITTAKLNIETPNATSQKYVNMTKTGIVTWTLESGSGTDLVLSKDVGPSGNLYLLAEQILSKDGNATTPSHSFANDLDTGIYRVGDNQLGFVTAGARSFFIGLEGDINMDAGNCINFDSGTVAAPGLRGGADPNTGIYIPNTDVLAIACGGFETARFKLSGSSDDTAYGMLNLWGGNNSAVTSFVHYTAINITTAKQIASIPNNTALVIVAGNDGSTNYFRDLVMAGYGGTPTVIVSTTESGSPSARTYSNAGAGVFRVAMASGTYKTQTLLIALGGR